MQQVQLRWETIHTLLVTLPFVDLAQVAVAPIQLVLEMVVMVVDILVMAAAEVVMVDIRELGLEVVVVQEDTLDREPMVVMVMPDKVAVGVLDSIIHQLGDRPAAVVSDFLVRELVARRQQQLAKVVKVDLVVVMVMMANLYQTIKSVRVISQGENSVVAAEDLVLLQAVGPAVVELLDLFGQQVQIPLSFHQLMLDQFYQRHSLKLI
jgi:hypothetical protein